MGLSIRHLPISKTGKSKNVRLHTNIFKSFYYAKGLIKNLMTKADYYKLNISLAFAQCPKHTEPMMNKPPRRPTSSSRSFGRPSSRPGSRPPGRPGQRPGARPGGRPGSRPSFGGDGPRSSGGSFGDRPARPSEGGGGYSARPSFGDRPARSSEGRPFRSGGGRPGGASSGRPSSGGSYGGGRPSFGGRPSRPGGGGSRFGGGRPAYGARPSYGDRPARPPEAPLTGEALEKATVEAYFESSRPRREERPSYGGRPSYGDRPSRPPGRFGDRPSYGERPQRSERPAYSDRPARPSFRDRPPSDRFSSDRREGDRRDSFDRRESQGRGDGARTEERRPSYGQRPAYGENRGSSSRERFGARPASRPYSNDKPYSKPYDRQASGDTASASFGYEKPAEKPAEKTSDKLADGCQYLYGRHAVLGVLEQSPERVAKVYIAEGLNPDRRLRLMEQLAKENGILLVKVPRPKLDRLMEDVEAEEGDGDLSHQGVMAAVSAQPLLDVPAFIEQVLVKRPKNTPCLIFMLDEVSDPRNLGALLRVADGAGAEGVILSKHRGATLSPSVAKTACGAESTVPIAVATNLGQALTQLKEAGFWTVATVCEPKNNEPQPDDAPPVTRFDLQDYKMPTALVLGSEGDGLRPSILKACDFHITIPMLGQVDSLNIATAAAVLAFEVARQQNRLAPVEIAEVALEA